MRVQRGKQLVRRLGRVSPLVVVVDLGWWLLLGLVLLLLPGLSSSGAADEKDSRSNSNPYYSGCFQAKLGKNWTQLRTCNSDDPPEAVALGLCEPPPFDNYLEIRTQIRNWDSILVLSWLTQIILSELVGVPTTIEAGPLLSQESNFYAPQSPRVLEYNNERYFEVVGTPTQLPNGDCRYASKGLQEDGDFDYQYCAHFIPEVWDTDGEWMTQMIVDNLAEPSQGMGILGKNTWFVTKFTVQNDSTLDSYHGLVGESNRHKLARTFLRPTTWKQYCQEVSPTDCTLPDQVAQRPPQTPEEEQRMFVQGQFTGHFRNTTANDCQTYPHNCTGHIGNFPCTWQSRMSATLYHLDIALSCTDGPTDDDTDLYGSYTVQQQIDMWDAANATKSNLIMLWWTPEPLYHRYLGTDAELQRVQLTPVTSECMERRWESVNECSYDLQERVGTTSPRGVCEEPPRLLQKVVSGNLLGVTQQYEEAIRSPAYQILRRFQFTEHQLGEIFQLWQATDKTPRDAVCEWAANNVEFLRGFVPYSYPRIAREEPNGIFSYVLVGLASLTVLLVLIFGWQVHVKRNYKSLQFAQIDFLWLLLTGSFIVGIGNILNSVPATNGTCIATIWFINIGYTLELVPLIVKVAAINQMMAAARRMSRITLSHQQLYGAVAIILGCCTIFLLIWTILDPPQKTPEYSLQEDERTESGQTVVGVQYYCQGDSDVWQYIAVGWNTVLLMSAAVLAFQTRSSVKAFNESGNLAILITSHFFFVLLRCGTFLMSDIWKNTLMIQVRSLIYSIDTMATLFIYFLPKLLANNHHNIPVTRSSMMGTMGGSGFSRSGSIHISGFDLGGTSSQIGNRRSRHSRQNSSDGHLSLGDIGAAEDDDDGIEDLDPDAFNEPKEGADNSDNNNKTFRLSTKNLSVSVKKKQISCPTCGHMCSKCAMAIATDGD